MSSEDSSVLVDVINHVGQLTLNRPASLNTLTLPMVRILHQTLKNWEDDPKIHAVLLRATGEKAFCAGGDIRALYESYQGNEELHQVFFDEEYDLNLYMHGYRKPTICLMNGIVLGGGMGLAQATGTRLATDHSRLGMPEVSIGFFPDVGAGYFLPRLPGELGTYLGVTGNHIKAADSLYCGWANAYLDSGKLPEFDAKLAALEWGDNPAVALLNLLESLTVKSLPDAQLQHLRPAIDEHFAKASVPAIRQSLLDERRPEYADWAKKTVEIIDSRSPTSVAVTLEYIRRGKHLSLDECFKQEHALAHRFMDDGDFMEGIRALIVDKDKSPRWNPPTLDAVTPERVAQFFPDSH